MNDELVKRHVEQLRLTGGDLADLCQPLADAIDALTAERDRLLKLLNAIVDEYNGQVHGPILYSINDALAALKGESHE